MSNIKPNSKKEKRESVIKAIRNPLGFYVLALLIVESLIACAVIGGGFSDSIKITFLIIGCVLFLIVIAIVTTLVWKKPENLTFDKEAHLYVIQMGLGDNKSEEYLNTDSIELTPPPIQIEQSKTQKRMK